MFFALIVCAGLVLLPYLLGPLLIKATHRALAQPTFEGVDPETRKIPEEPWLFFLKTLNALGPAGFQEAGYLFQTGQVPNVETWLLLLEKRATQEAAVAAAMDSTTAAAIKTRYVEFSVSYADGTSVSANNSSVMPAFAPVPGRHSFQFPSVEDPARLHRVHEALVGRLGSRAARRYPGEGEFAAFLQDAMARELARQIGTGYLVLDPTGTFYRATWKGAFLMTWKLLFPVKNVLGTRRDRASKRLLGELGL